MVPWYLGQSNGSTSYTYGMVFLDLTMTIGYLLTSGH